MSYNSGQFDMGWWGTMNRAVLQEQTLFKAIKVVPKGPYWET